MSRIGKRTTKVPQGVTVVQDGGQVIATGPAGSVSVAVDPRLKLDVKDGIASFALAKGVSSALWGTASANLGLAVAGANKPFVTEMKIDGVGFRAVLRGDRLGLSLGQTHPLDIAIPKGLKVEVPTPTELRVSGADKRVVGQFCADVRSFYKPEPYNGKGVTYKGERIIRKVGKTAEGAKK